MMPAIQHHEQQADDLGAKYAEMKAGSGGSQMRPKWGNGSKNLHTYKGSFGVNGWVNIPYIDNEHLGIMVYNRDPNGLS